MNKQEKDKELWNKWHEAGRGPNEHWEPLLNQLGPIVTQHTGIYAKQIDAPSAVLRSKVEERVIEGIHTYDPYHASGASLATHVTNKIKHSIPRDVLSFQNAGYRISEKRGWSKRTEYQNAVEDLEQELGYLPDTAAVAKRLGWQKTEVERMERDVLMTQPGTNPILSENVTLADTADDRAIREVRFQAGADTKEPLLGQIFEGFISSQKGQDIAKNLGISQTRVSKARQRLVGMLNKEQKKR